MITDFDSEQKNFNYGKIDLDFIKDECLFEIFEQTVDNFPNNIAVKFKGKSYTYKNIDLQANQLSRHLIKKGIERGDYVGIILERSAETYISMLAIMKAGAAYVPIESTFPEDRIKYIIDNCHTRKIITTEELAKKLSLENNTILIDTDKLLISEENDSRIYRDQTGVTNQDLCYVIYTSGSTGRPKGVQLEHRNVCNLVRASQSIYQIVPEDKVYQGFTTAFDASVEEIWMAFGNGATLIPATIEMQRSGSFLGKMLEEEEITVVSSVPTLLSLIADDIPTLRLLIFGGEVCPQHLIEKWSKPNRRLFNTYGPTEATVIATYSELKIGKKVTIGHPIPNYSTFILRDNGTKADIDQEGELLIGGIGLARGYLGKDDLTKEKFVYLPEINPDGDHRLYRTGDLVKFNQLGEIEFLGRIDDQVKIRGFRVELSEIEVVINSIDGVKTSITSLMELNHGIQTLVAYIIPKSKPENVNIDHLYEVLKTKLPAYMIPQQIEFIQEIPILANGKADRKNLPVPINNSRNSKNFIAPITDVEKKITEAWENAFGIDKISINDHFFYDLGGHSLLVSIVISNLRKNPSMETLKFSDIYESPTIEELAKKVDSEQVDVEARTNKSENRKNDFLHSSKLKHAICGLGQAFSVYIAYFLFAIPVLISFYLFFSDTLDFTTDKEILFTFLLSVVYFPFLLTLSIIVKWTVIGKFKAGKYPLWGSYYFRWWFVRLFQSLFPAFLLAGTPVMPLYLKLMGAKIGKNCYVGTSTVQIFDLLNIGEQSSIGLDSQLLGYTVEDGYLILGNIDIGKNCYIGTHSIISIDTKMQDKSMILEQSMLPTGKTIPKDECWSGSPAAKIEKRDDDIEEMMLLPTDLSAKNSFFIGFLHLIALYIFQLIPLVALFPVSYLMDLLYLDFNFLSVFFAPLGGLLFVVIMCTEIILLKKLTLGKVKHGIYNINSIFYFKKWIVDQLMYMSLSTLHSLYATIYTPIFLRFMGAKIGKNVEVSTVTHISPDLLSIGDYSFSADASMLGTPKIFNNKTKISEVKIGKKSFIGNSALLPINQVIGDNCLIGVLSTPPLRKEVESGSSWLGSPSIYLPKRDINTSFSEKQTYSPPKRLYIQRLIIEFIRVILPSTVSIVIFLSMLYILGHMDVYLYFSETILIFPLVMIGAELVGILIILIFKTLLIGRYKPKIRPLWSIFVWNTELVTGLYESISVPFFLNILRGTPFISWCLRILGAKIGKRVFLDSTFISEFDLVSLGDESAVNFNSTMQTHLFEDRVMKMSYLKIEKYCSIGNGSVVLYDTVMEEGAKLGNLSLLMKGETLISWSSWEGNPTRAI
ncbi:MAG: amino acid adenylation domain-containing protein [Candidatus Sericytochromatia bacterium]|nr:amino acid adenylation domain-containing protein [Candidatus Sericytochromatia bacterium]